MLPVAAVVVVVVVAAGPAIMTVAVPVAMVESVEPVAL